MSKVKKILAMVLALAMVLGTTLTAFAATGEKPTESDAKIVSVNGVEAGATYKAYQIIDADYDAYGFNSYVWAPGISVNDEIKAGVKVKDASAQITDAMITALAKDPSSLAEKKESFNPADDALEVGTWMILVTPPADNPSKVYNPMIVSVYYNVSGSDSGMASGSIDATKNWTLMATDSYAKSTEITIEKVVKDESEVLQEVGKPVGFSVTGTIPSYSEEYTSAKYDITDKIINGLKYTNDVPVVKVNGAVLTDGKEYKYSPGDGTFTISFDSDYILGLADKTVLERSVEITYSAKVTDAAITKIGENDVTLNYTTKPGDDSGAKKDKAYTFTFSLDGLLQKVTGDESGLAGATFTLYKDANLEEKFGEMTTTANGDFDIEFKGLDGDEKYYLKETAAPGGFSINETVYEISFNNIKKTGEIVTGYDVIIKNMTTDEIVTGSINYGEPSEEFVGTVVNTNLSELPSTGGIGTTIFTIGGCIIMIGAAGLFFASRRKSAKK